jgi:4-hydroxy-4-methyl-2-oxoglutarate aldolase
MGDQKEIRMDVEQTLKELGSATLGECGARTMRARIRPVWRGAVLAAPAVPVVCAPGDNLAIHVAVATARSGEALVVDVGAVPELGYWGEVLTTGAQSRGIAGLVIDGGVRDTAAIESLGFPVFSSMVALSGATKQADGSVGGSAVVAEALVELGDWVVGDADGVVIVPAASLEDVLTAARGRAEKEVGYFAALRAGSTTVDLLALDVSPVFIEESLRDGPPSQ